MAAPRGRVTAPRRMDQPHWAPERGAVWKASPPLKMMRVWPAMVPSWTRRKKGLRWKLVKTLRVLSALRQLVVCQGCLFGGEGEGEGLRTSID